MQIIETRSRVAPTNGIKHAAESTATISRTGSKLNVSSGSVLAPGLGTDDRQAQRAAALRTGARPAPDHAGT
jgi:hypothetical protein